MSLELCNERLDVEKILQSHSNKMYLQFPSEFMKFVPDKETVMRAADWKYSRSAAKAYLPSIAIQNVFDAIQSGSISSAGFIG